jgi:hypothetical protein
MTDSQVLALLTAGLAVMTGWLAWETRDMARATKQMALLSAEPYLSLLRVHLEGRREAAAGLNSPTVGFILRLVLSNPGQVRIYYEVRTFLVTLDRGTFPPSKFDSRGGYIHIILPVFQKF